MSGILETEFLSKTQFLSVHYNPSSGGDMRKIKITAGHYYHIYNRGVAKQPIFFCRENWAYMIQRLGHYFTPEQAEIVAYCLMPNHYHQYFTICHSERVNRRSSLWRSTSEESRFA